LIFIVFLTRKKHSRGKPLADWRGLERLCFASASLFLLSALNSCAVATRSHLGLQSGRFSCFIENENTEPRPDRESRSLLSCLQKPEGT
jgi:hypothetical protein